MYYLVIVIIPTRDVPARNDMSIGSIALLSVPCLAILCAKCMHPKTMLGNSEDVIILLLSLSLMCPRLPFSSHVMDITSQEVSIWDVRCQQGNNVS